MTTAPLPATPDLMTMLCRIGAGMREAMPSGVYLQFLLIGVMCSRFGALLEAWLFVEERLAAKLAAGGFDDASDDDADMQSGWLSQEGPVWRWRHVTRFGSVLVIPVRWFVGRAEVCGLQAGSVRAPVWSVVLMAVPPRGSFFRPGWAWVSNCVHFVPGC